MSCASTEVIYTHVLSFKALDLGGVESRATHFLCRTFSTPHEYLKIVTQLPGIL
jgi:hypothetical protein